MEGNIYPILDTVAEIKNEEVQCINSPSELELRLAVGQQFSCPDEAYTLYVKYAISKGFSVRKGKNYTFWKSSEIRAKLFLCNKEGESQRKSSKEVDNKQYYNLDTREKCGAQLYIVREKDSPWKVIKFVTEHTHELAAPDELHLLKSARKISEAKSGTLESLVNAGIKTIHAFNYMEKECGGPEKVGFLKKDAYNLINQIKNSRISGGDCQQVFNHFQSRVTENSGFYWDADFDQNGRMYNFFWRDNRCCIDYECFGDIVTFDTTYLTNRYQLICAPFIGVNHHGQNIMFGCAFLSDEKTSSFEWLFKAFLKAMGNKHPQTIFTDQCQAMINAIENVFPHTCHRLCQWHINKNAPSHFGSLNSEPEFKSLWKKCMKYCESEMEFEETWDEMMNKFKLHHHSWLNKMYEIRKKWSTAFSRDKFNCGLKSTSRSESANNSLKEMCTRSTSLYDFVIGFEEVVRKWRRNEKEEDFRCKNGRPFLVVKNNPLLAQAAKVYTCAIYLKFQKELQEGTMGHAVVDVIPLEGISRLYNIKSHGIDKRVRTVVFDKSSQELKCSCKKFECSGILCAHALKVLDHENVIEIPEKCVNRRWTKEMKSRIHVVLHGESSEVGGLEESEMVFVNSTMRFVYDLVMQSKPHLETRKLLKDALENVALQLDDWRHKELTLSSDEGRSALKAFEGNDIHIQDPPVKSKKNSSQKHKSHWDVQGKKKRLCNVVTSRKPKKNAKGIDQLCESNRNLNGMRQVTSQASEQSIEHFTSSTLELSKNSQGVEHDLTMSVPSGYFTNTLLGVDYRDIPSVNIIQDLSNFDGKLK